MATIRVDPGEMDWGSAVGFFGPQAVHDGRDIVQLKVLSDRRDEGGGTVWLLRFAPPPGKLIKVIATARSDEHSFVLEGGRATKSGEPRKASGGYALNTEGQPHSAMIAQETTALVVYTGEPDVVHALELVDLEAAPQAR